MQHGAFVHTMRRQQYIREKVTQMSEIYYGRGNEMLYDDYMDFINYVFGFNGNGQDFKKLLPKLYKPAFKPVESSYITLEDGKLRAAVGAFDHKLMVCGTELKCRGIGNVAVHPYHRSRGFMRALMNMSVDDMIADGVVLSELGGRRQRYNYFSYEKTGTAYHFSVNSDNIRHCFGAEPDKYRTVSLRRLSADDTGFLSDIGRLLASQPYNPCRPSAELYDIMSAWGCCVYAVLKADTFAGYAVAGSKSVHEIMLADDNDFIPAIIALYEKFDGAYSITLPPFRPEYIKKLYRVCEGYEIVTDKSFSVLNYRVVTEAFAKLKLTYTEVPDGELTLLVHGRAGDERLRIAVCGGEASVSEHTGTCELELDHIDAMNMLFSPMCPGREALSDFARLLLPLPIWLYYADAV